jgi:hypothetical protein
MRGTVAMLGAAVMLVWASAASAQQPDFSGQWTVDTAKTQAANPGMGAGGQGGGFGGGGFGGAMGRMGVRLDDTSFTIERNTPQGMNRMIYRLDGTPTRVSMGPMEGTATARRDGNTIVVEQTVQGQQGTRTSRTVYAIDGPHLVATMTTTGREGNQVTRTTYYTRD